MQTYKNRVNKIFQRICQDEMFNLSHLVAKFVPYLEDNYFDSAEKIPVIQNKICEICDILKDDKHNEFRNVKRLFDCIQYCLLLF